MADMLEAGSGSQKKRKGLRDGSKYKKRGRIIAVMKRASRSFSNLNKSSLAAAQHPEDYDDVDEHLLSLEVLASRYKTAVDMQDPAKSIGLSHAEAHERLARDGKNVLNPPKPQNPVLQYLKLLAEPLTAMLLAASVLALCSQAASPDDYTPTYLGAVLFIVVTGNTIVDFWQARKSEAMVKVRERSACCMLLLLLLLLRAHISIAAEMCQTEQQQNC
jgi:magnesium-transporting ATPase (P-type)